MTKLKQILEHIKSNPGQTSKEISEITDILYDTVRTCVSTLCGRGDIQMMHAGKKRPTYKSSVLGGSYLLPFHVEPLGRTL